MRRNGNNRKRKVAPSSTAMVSHESIQLLDSVEDGINLAGRQTWNFFHNLPIQGALTSGALGLWAATVFGVAELAVAGLSAYVTYRMFAFGEPLLEAIEKTIKFEKGELPERDILARRQVRQAAA